jgi:hypothetical protein
MQEDYINDSISSYTFDVGFVGVTLCIHYLVHYNPLFYLVTARLYCMPNKKNTLSKC